MVPARIINYEGRLGKFSYNTAEFEVVVKYTAAGSFEVLHYKGREIDGDKIQIPNGVINGAYMFEGKSLRTPTILPASIQNVSYMFKGCVSLMRGAILPYGVKKTGFMYQGCRSMTFCPDMPDTVEEAPYMFDGCTQLVRPPHLSSNLHNVSGIFRGCLRLSVVPNIPTSVKRGDYMFRDCRVLNEVTYGGNVVGEPLDV